MTSVPRFLLASAAALLAIVFGLGTVQAQTSTAPKVLYACYGSLTGVVYRIKEPGTPANCLHPTHIQFSWTDGVDAIRTGAPAGGDFSGTYPNPSLASNAVTSSKIVDNTIDNSDIADNSLDATSLATGSVRSDELLDDTIDDADVADNALDASSLATGAVASDEILDASITADDIAPGVISGGGSCSNACVNTASIADGAVTGPKIADGAVTAPKIADGAVSGTKIADGSIGGPDIATGAVVRSVNGLTEGVTLAAGTGVTITPNDQTLTISSAGGVTSGTSTNTPNTLVQRDGSGSFSAGSVNLAGSINLDPTSRVTLGGARFLYRTVAGTATSVFLGTAAGDPASTGIANVGMGHMALQAVTSGGRNTALGASAGLRLTSGGNNALVGYLAGTSLIGGTANVAVGMTSLANLSGSDPNSSFNTAVGSGALFRLSDGSGNLALGVNAGTNLIGAESYNVYIANDGVAGESRAIRIGTPGLQTAAFVTGISGTTAASGVAVFVNGNGQLGTTTSSARFKLDVHDMGAASAALHQLRPVSFRYRPELDSTGILQYGLIAEEVDRIAPELVVRDSLGQPYTVRYHLLVPMLLNEVQRLERERKVQQAAVRAMERRLARLEAAAKP